MKNPEQGPKPRINAQWFGRWISVFAVYPPEHGPAFVAPEPESESELEREPRVNPTEDELSSSQMMLFLTGMANHAMQYRTEMTGSPNADYEWRWYISSLIHALHTIQDEHAPHTAADTSINLMVSYNDLRRRADVAASFEAVVDGDLPVADVVSYHAAQQYTELYEQARQS